MLPAHLYSIAFTAVPLTPSIGCLRPPGLPARDSVRTIESSDCNIPRSHTPTFTDEDGNSLTIAMCDFISDGELDYSLNGQSDTDAWPGNVHSPSRLICSKVVPFQVTFVLTPSDERSPSSATSPIYRTTAL